jgi:RNA polymerase sigma-70 factor, ECF subfamily
LVISVRDDSRVPAIIVYTPNKQQQEEHPMDDKSTTGESLDFDALYAAYRSAVYRFFFQQLGDAQEAEDLTATTFSKALASRNRYREQGRLTAWLFGIARHTLLDARRRARPRIDLARVATALADPAPSPEARALQSEQARQLHELLQYLPADQQEALILRFFGDLGIGEIAARMGRSTGAIKMLIYRAMAQLRERYRQAEQAAAHIVLGCSVPAWLQYALQPVVRDPVHRRHIR